MSENILEVRNLTKNFPGVVALDNINLDIKKGVTHCIVGENGAGKSTFIKIITGALSKTEGSIIYSGQEYNPRSISEAMKNGMSTLYQELNVVEQLTVEQNLNLGKEKHILSFMKKSEQDLKAIEILKAIEPRIDIKQLVANLSTAQRQILEIARAIATDAKVIIMDEPTAAITEEETKKLFKVIENLKEKNVTIIYISHRLSDIFEIGDYVSVFRDGKLIATKAISEISSSLELVKMMIGKIVTESYIPNEVNYNKKVLQVKELNDTKLKDISFDLFEGEIIGFYGLVGAGKTEIAKAIYGLRDSKGAIIIGDRTRKINTPEKAIKSGIAMVPEERRTEGLFTELTVRDNIPVMNMQKVSRFGIRSKRKEALIARDFIKKLKIVTPSEEKKVALLSGGNQQKVVIAKCLNAESRILLLDEPTRGVDVGAKEEIHNLIRNLAKQKVSVIIFSSELQEILILCDRIFTMFNGSLKAVFKNGTEDISYKILHTALVGES